MEFFNFLFFAILESASFFFFILVLFRFSLKENYWKFILVSIVLGLVSNSLQVEELRSVSSLIQVLLVIFFVTFILRLHLFNSVIVVITGYLVIFIIQWLIAFLHYYTNGTQEIDPYSPTAFLIQTVSAFLVFMFGGFTWWRKGGFSFIDNKSRLTGKQIFLKENRMFIIFILLAVIGMFIALLFFILTPDPPYLYLSIWLLISLSGLIYISMKRDERQDG